MEGLGRRECNKRKRYKRERKRERKGGQEEDIRIGSHHRDVVLLNEGAGVLVAGNSASCVGFEVAVRGSGVLGVELDVVEVAYGHAADCN